MSQKDYPYWESPNDKASQRYVKPSEWVWNNVKTYGTASPTSIDLIRTILDYLDLKDKE